MPLIDYFRKRVVVDEPVTPRSAAAPQDRRHQPRKMFRPEPLCSSSTTQKPWSPRLAKCRATITSIRSKPSTAKPGAKSSKKNKPDLIFLDIIRPGISGFDVLRRIRRSTYVGKVPVIVMSGNEAAAEEYDVRRIGADDFLRKPCSRAEVFSRVERLLDLKPNALRAAAGDGHEMLPLDRS